MLLYYIAVLCHFGQNTRYGGQQAELYNQALQPCLYKIKVSSMWNLFLRY